MSNRIISRNDSYGFVDEDSYWNIGSEDQRGKDGDDARVAARKYNDHRHSAAELGTDTLKYFGFLYEGKPIDNPMGIDYEVQDPTTVTSLRKPGDLVRFKGLLWMYDEYNQAVPLGVGPGCYFKPDVDNSNGRFVREAMTSQELICGREEIVRTDTLPAIDENGVEVLLRLPYKEIGGVLLDMSMHSMHRSRPMVRFECTGVVVHDGSSPYENLRVQNNQTQFQNTSLGDILAEFLLYTRAKAGEVKFIWDRNGELPQDEAIREFSFQTRNEDEVSPLYINDATMGGVTTQRSDFVLLDLDRSYVIRVRARLRTFDTDAEIVDEWNKFRTVVVDGDYEGLPNINLLPEIADVFGGVTDDALNAEEGTTLYDKIRYWQSSDCTFEILNVKIRIDNFLGLPPEIHQNIRRTSLTPPDDRSEDYDV